MNKNEIREKEPYETPEVLDVKPVSVVRGDGPDPSGYSEFYED